ncbi:unnamed protein product [Meloidogyne enterolobii]|uniref:Uncharacterized protein n=1 Tax=Meloidogyne enterolobii TaxID=390850 RepID=A0ACB1ASQ9_MELEN
MKIKSSHRILWPVYISCFEISILARVFFDFEDVEIISGTRFLKISLLRNNFSLLKT